MSENDKLNREVQLTIRLRSMRNELRQNPSSIILRTITLDFFAMLLTPEIYYKQLILFGYSHEDIDNFVNDMFALVASEKARQERKENSEH